MRSADRFEQDFVFRIARSLPLCLSVAAIAVLVIAVIALAFSVVPVASPPIQTVAVTAPPPAPVRVSLADVQSRLGEQIEMERTGVRAADATGATTAQRTSAAEARALAVTLDSLRRAVGTGDAWDNQISVYVKSVLDELAGPGEGSRWVRVPSGEEFYLDVSNAPAKRAVLAEALQIVRALPAADRGRAIRVWSDLRVQRERELKAAPDIARQQAEAARRSAQAAYESALTARRDQRASAVTAIGGALLALLLSGLLLALLAIERNTRRSAAPLPE